MPLTIIFVDQDDSDPPIVRGFYPLRRAILRRFEISGSILYVYFQLKDYINWKQPGSDQWDGALQGIDAALRPPARYIVSYQKASDQIAKAILQIDADPPSAKAWESTVDKLCSLDSFQNVVFYRVVECTRIVQAHWLQRHIPWYTPSPARKREVPLWETVYDSTGYSITSELTFTIILDFYRPRYRPGATAGILMPKIPDGTTVTPILDNSLFAFAPTNIPVTFRYDRKVIELIPNVSSRDVFTVLHIGMSRENTAPTTTAFKVPDIDLMLRVNYRRDRVLLWLVAILVGQILTKVDVFTKFPDNPVNIPAASFIVGTVLTLISLYNLLGKLPGAFG